MPLQTRMHKTHMQRLSCPTGGLPGGAEPSPDATIEASRSARTRPPARLVEQWWLLIQKTNTSASPPRIKRGVRGPPRPSVPELGPENRRKEQIYV